MSNHDGGKGDKPRILGIPYDQFEQNWDKIFKKESKVNPNIVEEADGSLTINVEGDNNEYSYNWDDR